MLEQQIEKKVIEILKGFFIDEKLNHFIEFSGLYSVDENKCVEDKKPVLITVKVSPPTFETPTIPDSQIQIDVSCMVRSDIDYDGKTYLQIIDVLSKIFYTLQLKFKDVYQSFHIPYMFDPTGLVVANGDSGVEREQCLFFYTRTINLYGIICCCYTKKF